MMQCCRNIINRITGAVFGVTGDMLSAADAAVTSFGGEYLIQNGIALAMYRHVDADKRKNYRSIPNGSSGRPTPTYRFFDTLRPPR